MRMVPTTLLAASLALALSACGPRDEVDDAATPPVAPDAADVSGANGTTGAAGASAPGEVDVSTATLPGGVAVLTATEGNAVTGELVFRAIEGGVAITGQVNGLPPGSEHGFHVHENGDCSAPDGSSAGGHFNPMGQAHGRAGGGEHHVGDSDNITADDTGVATVDTRLVGATLGDGGPGDVIGRGVIVHADPDDYATQPTGNAGARLACGVVQVGGEGPAPM